jgi:DNA repair protein RecN (Recombination protein N)
MLKKLFIVNYAVIDRIEVEFEKGFCIITGETGAGKSILIDALELALGSRTDTGSIRDKEQKCIVEAEFDISKNQPLIHWLKENDLDANNDLILRREFSIAGKSRAFINDTPVSLQQLKMIRTNLIDLHQQFDNVELTGSDYQRNTVDLVAGCEKEVETYFTSYGTFKSLRNEIESLKQKAGQEQKERDYRQYLLDELENASLTNDEIESAANELALLEHSEEIAALLSQFKFLLQEGDEAFLPKIKILLQKIRPYINLNSELKDLEKRLSDTYTELTDITQDINKQENEFQPDNRKKQQLSDRIDLGYKLMKKHQVKTTSELIDIQKQLQKILDASREPEIVIAEKSKQLSLLEKELHQQAELIHKKREKSIPSLVKKMNQLLHQVGMPNARFDIVLHKKDILSPYGMNDIHFVFNANIPAGETGEKTELKPIGEISSGGELSRLMLCLQSFIAEKTALPVLVFDEIDAGISGEAARQVGLLMKKMAEKHQLIAITHMPQVAARADNHYFVFKEEKQNTIRTQLKKLKTSEHIEAIAQMISGNEMTEATLNMAKELIEREK